MASASGVAKKSWRGQVVHLPILIPNHSNFLNKKKKMSSLGQFLLEPEKLCEHNRLPTTFSHTGVFVVLHKMSLKHRKPHIGQKQLRSGLILFLMIDQSVNMNPGCSPSPSNSPFIQLLDLFLSLLQTLDVLNMITFSL